MSGITELNREYFDKEAAEYDRKHGRTLQKILDKVRAKLDFIGADWADDDDDDDDNDDVGDGEGGGKANTDAIGGAPSSNPEPPAKKSVKLLDYACGTGNLSRALAPYTTQCIGVDISNSMVAAYNAHARNQGLTPSEMCAFAGDLCGPSPTVPPALSAAGLFDVAAVGLGFHHLPDPALAARRLAERLRPGGVLVVVDFLEHAAHAAAGAAGQTVTHHGFTEGEVREIFEGAGVGGGFGIVEIGGARMGAGGGHERRVFIARGEKV